MAQREREAKEQLQRYALQQSSLGVLPDNPTDRHTLMARAVFVHPAGGESSCADTASARIQRDGSVITVLYPAVPCENPYINGIAPIELPLGRLPPGEYKLMLEIPNDIGVSPARSLTLTVRPVGTPEAALMVAVEQGAADVADVTGSTKYSQDTLDTALSHACQRPGQDRSNDEPAIVRALLRAGAKPQSALHAAAIGAPRCLSELLAAGADPNLDIATLPGLPLGSGSNAPRFKPAPSGTPLYFAVRGRHKENVQRLLAAGANPNKTFQGGESAYSTSMRIGDDAVARDIRAQLEAHSGTLTVVQRGALAAETITGTVKAGAFIAVCQFAAWTTGSCMH